MTYLVFRPKVIYFMFRCIRF